MTDHLEKSLEALKKYFDSPAFAEELKLMKIKNDIQSNRYAKLEKYLESLTKGQLTEFMDKLIEEHDDELSDYWYKKGIVPNLTNKMQFLFNYMYTQNSLAKSVTKKEYKQYETGFGDAMVKYKGYVFQMFFGQGTAYRINKAGDIIFQW